MPDAHESPRIRPVTLLTDFGSADPFVGIMKGVIMGICPSAKIVDLTHGIGPQDIVAGAVAWADAWRYFPPGTVHVGVVDPGVGTNRRAIAAEIDDAVFICPDNGLITLVAAGGNVRRVVRIENPAYVRPALSRTFHGRDVFAPAAAHVAGGVDLDEFGPRIGDFIRLSLTKPDVNGDLVIARVLYFDGFGNAYTNLALGDLPANGPWTVRIGDTDVGTIVETYAGVDVGRPMALFASHGRLEIAVRNGNAREDLGLKIGDEIRIERIPRTTGGRIEES